MSKNIIYTVYTGTSRHYIWIYLIKSCLFTYCVKVGAFNLNSYVNLSFKYYLTLSMIFLNVNVIYVRLNYKKCGFYKPTWQKLLPM